MPARDYGYQLVHYLRKGITFADNGLTVTIGDIPAGSLILRPVSGVAIHVAFNGATTNTLDIGPSTDAGTNLYATLLALGSIGYVALDEAVTNLVTVETRVQAAVVSTTGATAGVGEVLIAYAPDNDM
jgi:hypothetical protein